MRQLQDQMEQGNPRPRCTPLKLLALAYGLIPELQAKLRPSGDGC